jgi:hypothetical protein
VGQTIAWPILSGTSTFYVTWDVTNAWVWQGKTEQKCCIGRMHICKEPILQIDSLQNRLWDGDCGQEFHLVISFGLPPLEESGKKEEYTKRRVELWFSQQDVLSHLQRELWSWKGPSEMP